MNKNERKAEKERSWQEECAAREREYARKEALPMWDRIEESDASPDVKDILHRIAQHLGLEA